MDNTTNNDITRDASMNVAELMAQRNRQLNQTETQQYTHGDYVPGKDGEPGGFLIDSEQQLRDLTEAPQINDLKKYISGQREQIERLRAGESPATVLGDTGNPSSDAEISNSMTNIQHKVEIEKVRKAFDGMEMSATGLSPAGSHEAEEFKRKMNDLNAGKVNLDDYKDVSQTKPEPPVQKYTPVEEQPDDGPDIVQFNVDANKADVFISTLSKEDRQKVQVAPVIVVSEVETLEVPTTTRYISDMNEYRRITPRAVTLDVVECVLPNSGYVATVKGCGALAMATILSEFNSGNVAADTNRRFKFCYDNLVTTSIGKLSFQEFLANTSVSDLNILLFNILKVTETDEQPVTLTCNDPSCGKDYEVTYKISELLDVDNISDDLAKHIESIVAARDVVDRALAKHRESPVMLAKYVKIVQPDRTLIIEIKSPDATVFIDRISIMEGIASSYSTAILGFVMGIPKIYATFTQRGESEPATYEITDAFVIAEILGSLNDKAVQILQSVMSKMGGYDAMTYSFKGPYKCPHCGKIYQNIPCDVDNLIFFRVSRAMS